MGLFLDKDESVLKFNRFVVAKTKNIIYMYIYAHIYKSYVCIYHTHHKLYHVLYVLFSYIVVYNT